MCRHIVRGRDKTIGVIFIDDDDEIREGETHFDID